jgi:hypothetical protein
VGAVRRSRRSGPRSTASSHRVRPRPLRADYTRCSSSFDDLRQDVKSRRRPAPPRVAVVTVATRARPSPRLTALRGGTYSQHLQDRGRPTGPRPATRGSTASVRAPAPDHSSNTASGLHQTGSQERRCYTVTGLALRRCRTPPTAATTQRHHPAANTHGVAHIRRPAIQPTSGSMPIVRGPRLTRLRRRWDKVETGTDRPETTVNPA